VGKDEPMEIIAFTDSNWGGDKDSGKSTSGTVVKMGQNVVTRGINKAEVCCIVNTRSRVHCGSMGTKTAVWFKHVADELHLDVNSPILMFIDNKASINFTKNRKTVNPYCKDQLV
jgi:hypothetical protein